MVKTFGRAHLVARLIQSLRNIYLSIPAIIIDDALFVYNINPKMKMKYNLLKNASNILYLTMKYNSGASAGRNLGLSFVKTPYFLIVDDDFYFHKDTNLEYVSYCK